MIDIAAIRRSVDGALRLARGDAGGLDCFDMSVEGFWRSFQVMLLAAPFYLLLVLQRRFEFGAGLDPGTLLAEETLPYVVGWLAFPLIALPLTWFLGLSTRFVPLVVALNWTAGVQIAALTGAVLVGTLLPPELSDFLMLLISVALLFYEWFVMRTALQTGGGVAFGFLTVDFLLGLLVNALLAPTLA